MAESRGNLGSVLEMDSLEDIPEEFVSIQLPSLAVCVQVFFLKNASRSSFDRLNASIGRRSFSLLSPAMRYLAAIPLVVLRPIHGAHSRRHTKPLR